MSDRNTTCAERIAEHRNGRLSYIGALVDLATAYSVADLDAVTEDETTCDVLNELSQGEAMTRDELNDAAQTAMWELPLGITTQTVHRIDLSMGGPADWLEVFADSDGDITRVVYHFADWFDHAEVELQGHDLRVAEEFARTVIGLD